MKLVNLELKLFRQHEATYLDFKSGLIGIIGANGAGKTSLVEAIAFALYGSKALRGKNHDVCTRGKDGTPTVTLVFEHDGTNYRVKRRLGDAELFQGGETTPLCSGSRDVTSRIELLLRMNHEEFIATYLTEQKGLEFLSGQRGAAERERFIVRMLGYDKLERAQELLRADKKEKRQEIAAWEGSLGSIEELRQRREREELLVKEIQSKHGEAVKVLEQAERESESIKGKIDSLREKRSLYLKGRDEVLTKQARFEERSKRITALEEERRALLLRQSNGVSFKEILEGGDLEKRISDIRLKLNEDEAVLIDIRKTLLDYENTIKGKQAEIGGAIATYERNYAAALSHLNKHRALGREGKCPTCGQGLGASFSQVEKGLVASCEQLAEELANTKGVLDGLSKPSLEQQTLTSKQEELQRQYISNKSVIEQLLSFEKELLAHSRIEDELVSARKDLEHLDSELKLIRKNINELGFSEEEYTKLKVAFDASSGLCEVARLQRVRLEGELDREEALLKRTELEIVQLEERNIVLQHSKAKLILLEEGDKVLTEFRKYLNVSIRPELARLASEFIAELTDGRYNAVELEEDFSPTVLEDGEPKAVISGGEEDILNLCLRLALSHMLSERAGSSFALLILDEVFGSLDEGRRINVLTLLEKLGKRFEQILVITHLDDIREGVEHLIYMEYDEPSGTSRLGGGEEVYDEVVNV